jgi:hypothetical protein
MKPNKPEDFWKKVNKSNANGCWEWTAATIKGYGCFWINGKSYYAHRYSMLLAGQDPTGYDILHSCDNPSCVNPSHLSLGTHADNMKDMKNKGRAHTGKNLRIKLLDENQIKEIRNSLDTHANLSRKYNVSSYTIQDVRSYKTYKYVN